MMQSPFVHLDSSIDNISFKIIYLVSCNEGILVIYKTMKQHPLKSVSTNN